MKPLWNATILIAFILAATSCKSPLGIQSDAVTGATPGYKQGEITLPPQSDTYDVIGVVDGLKNFVVKYDDTFYRGGQPLEVSAVQSLKKYGIRTIISVTPTEYERALCRDYGFTLIEIPFEKTTGVSPVELKWFLQTMRSDAGPFYVHCYGGAERGGALGVAYRLHIQEWPYERALLEYGQLGGNLASHALLESMRGPGE